MKVQKIILLQKYTHQLLLDAFTNAKKLMMSYIQTMNTPIWIDTPKGYLTDILKNARSMVNLPTQNIQFLERGKHKEKHKK